MSEGLFFAGNGVPIARPEDIKPYLGKPYHWREGRSAYEAAHSWLDANGVPSAVRDLLENDPALSQATLVCATFERQTKLDEFGRPSQTDVLALLKTPVGLAVLGIEAKVDETFGPTVDEWLVDASSGKTARLAGLLARLELDTEEVGSLRYQLLHRTVATLLEAEAAGVKDAALVVQSFSPPTIRAGLADFQRFAEALGLSIEATGRLSSAVVRSGIRLRLGWAQDRIRGESPSP